MLGSFLEKKFRRIGHADQSCRSHFKNADLVSSAEAILRRAHNPVIVMAADTVIVTAEHIVPVGLIAPDHVVTPAPVVDYLVANP